MTETARVLHSPLGASTSDRWINCPGSPGLIATLPKELRDRASPYALSGTAMHYAAQQWMTSGREPDWSTFNWEGIELEDDEIEAVRFYVALLYSEQAEHGGDILIEKRFSLERLRKGMWGTNDAILVGCSDKVLRVFDFKGGRGVVVDVVGNSQLLYYGYGAVINLPGTGADTLELVIVQPRAKHPDGPVRRWRVDLLSVFDWSIDLKRAADRTDDPLAPLKAGDWCQFCPALGVCTVARDYRAAQAGVQFPDLTKPGEIMVAPTLPDPRALSPEQLGRLLPALGGLKEWMESAWECAHAIAESGREIPGFKLVAKRGKRQWVGEVHDLVASLHGLGLDDGKLFKTELKSPAQVEKLLPKSRQGEIAPLCVMVSSGTTLAPADDPKPAVAPSGFTAFPVLPPGDDPAALPPALQ